MCFLPCLSESISDLVSRSEADDVLGLVGGKGCWDEAKYFCDVIAKPLIYRSDGFLRRAQTFRFCLR